ncbi:hypothetical protein AGMMS50276_23980 [Synergistales bacterium]|nr:hypothetical protein AGMMS50276_23980 [Synergistales bacterium]
MKMKRIMIAALVLSVFAASAAADVLYTTVDASYTSGTLGAIGENLLVTQPLVSNLTGDTLLFTFKNGGDDRVVVVDKNADGTGDRIFVYDPKPKNWSIVGNKELPGAVNIHGMTVSSVAAASGKLYIAAYGNIASNKAGAVLAASTTDYTLLPIEPYTPKADGEYLPHGEKVIVLGDYIYALFSMGNSSFEYAPSKLVKLDLNLNFVAEYEVGKNAIGMTPWDNGLAVAYYDGYQGQGSVGGVDFFHPTTGLVTSLVDGVKLGGGGMVPSVCRADANTLYFIGQQYDENYVSTSKLYRLRGGAIKEIADISSAGYTYSVNYDAKNGVVAVAAGDSIVLYENSDGTELGKFNPAKLGGNVYSLAILDSASGGGSGGGGSGGGCDVGVLGLLVLIIPAFLFVTRKKSRAW